jgi:hypothetical protein
MNMKVAFSVPQPEVSQDCVATPSAFARDYNCPMKNGRGVGLDILGCLELYTVRISILEHLLKHSDVKDWKEQARQMSAKAAPREIVHQGFAAAAIR